MPKRRLYLDDAAATPIAPPVLKAMRPFWSTQFGNPASLHAEGVAAQQAVEAARKSLAESIEALPDEILFTGSATESNNLAVFSAAALAGDKRHLIISAIEHPSVTEAANELVRRGFELTILPVDHDGLISVKEFSAAIRPDTFFASVIFANNEIGTIQPIVELGKLCHKRGVLFHTDACQAAAWLPLRSVALHADFITINAAKMHGPKGVSLLYHRRGLKLQPMLFGGGQESSLRSGTENVAGIVGFAEAFDWTKKQFRNVDRVRQLRDWFIEQVTKLPGVRLNGHPTQRLPNNINLSIEGVGGEALVLGLDALGVAASSGSACSALQEDGSPVLKAIGATTGGNVRLSLDWSTTKSDLQRTLHALKTVIERQRPVEVHWQKTLKQHLPPA